MRYYSSTAQPTTLSAAATDVATSIQVSATTGFPAVEFILALDYGTAQQELVKVTAEAGATLTVVRGFDGTTPQAHSIGAAVRHVHSADDFRLSRTHEAATSAVHGVAGGLVGTSDAQALSNKDLSSGTNTFPNTLASAATLSAHAAATSAHGTTGAVVGTTDAQALSNKDLTAATNTFPTSLVTLAGTQALTNKTLTSPVVTGMTLDGVNVSGAWATWTPTVTGVTAGNGTTVARFQQIGKTVHFYYDFTLGSTSAVTGAVTVSLPVAAASTAAVQGLSTRAYDSSPGVWYPGQTYGETGTAVSIASASGASGALTAYASTGPFTWATGDRIQLRGTYEAA